MRLVIILFAFFGWLWNNDHDANIVMPEICDNGIDDDMDGLIDLNDTVDCKCDGIIKKVFYTSSLIPNPSFEDYIDCPTGLAQLDSAEHWIQASVATSDYYNTCDFRFDQGRGEPPQPLPSGDGYVGILELDYYDHPRYRQPWQEYVGACLVQPLKLNREYKLQFYLGFGYPGYSYRAAPSVEISLFGTSNCRNLPFGDDDATLCPTEEDPSWFEIAKIEKSGKNEWVVAEMTFIPRRRIAAVAIGYSCFTRTNTDDYYHFIDDLRLNEAEEFSVPELEIDGDICDRDLILRANQVDDVDYQWFRNGVAIIGENDHELAMMDRDTGTYVLRISDTSGCQISQEFGFYPDRFLANMDTTICQGDNFMFDGMLIRDDFLDTFHYPAFRYCDSVIILQVNVNDTSSVTIDTTICENEILELHGEQFDTEGRYQIALSNRDGCDSFLHINLTVQDTVFRSVDHYICPGDSVLVEGEYFKEKGRFIRNISELDVCDIELEIDIFIRDTVWKLIDTTICSGQPLFAGGTPLFAPTDIQIDLADQYGCDSTITYQVEIAPLSDIRRDTNMCEGDEIIILGRRIDSAGEYVFNFQTKYGCDSTITYKVDETRPYFENQDTVLCEGEELIVFRDTITSAGTYTIQKYGGDCDSIIEIEVDFLDQPEYQSELIQPILCHGDENAIIEVQLQNQSYVLIWDDGFQGLRREDLGPGTYYFSISHGLNECSVSDSIVVTEPDPIVFEYSKVDIPCQTDDDGQIIIDELSGGTGQWNVSLDGVTMPPNRRTFVGLSAGIKQLIVWDENGCSKSEQITIEKKSEGDLTVRVSVNKVVLGDSVVLTVETSGIDSLVKLEWRGPNGNCLDDCYRWVVFPPKGSSEYILTATDSKGCTYEFVVVLEATRQFFVPNVFTPNGDQINDFFTLFDDGSIAELRKMQIFDRWGELIWQGENIQPSIPELGWDGHFNGEPMNPAVFVYFIEALDKGGKTHYLSGDVTLLD